MPTDGQIHAIAPVQTGPTISEPLRRFLTAARSAGVRISSAESIDAMRAVEVVGFSDRTVLRDSLSLLVAKSVEEKQIFEDCFELYFQRNDFAKPNEPGWRTPQAEDEDDHDEDGGNQGGGPGGTGGAQGMGGGQGQGGRAAGDKLAQMLLADDRAGQAADLAEPGIQIVLGDGRFGHVPLWAVLPHPDRVQHDPASGEYRYRYAEGLALGGFRRRVVSGGRVRPGGWRSGAVRRGAAGWR